VGVGAGGGVGSPNAFNNIPAELGLKPWALDYTPMQPSDMPDLPGDIIANPRTLRYDPNAWDAGLRAMPAFTEFATRFDAWKDIDSRWFKSDAGRPVFQAGVDDEQAAGWDDLSWRPIAPQSPQAAAATDDRILQEVARLKALMEDDRDRYLAEIVAQQDGAAFYWLAVLGIGESRKPWTTALIHFALRTGEMAAMHFKRKYARPRPSFLCPGLLVPFGPPGHPAFPSGHSTQSHLMTYVLLEVDGIKARFNKELRWLANRVATNRERAGLHYRSDSTAGKHLAMGIVCGLMGRGGENFPCPEFFSAGAGTGLLAEAKREWA
jgi:hypothetical protein